jgi:endonuclease/exonuclease/phosphatase (EEP) superfamily protein YafD
MKLRWLLVGLLLVLLLVPAGALTFARLLEPTGARWVRLVSFTPYAVVLYGLALLLLLLAWARGHGGWRVLARTLALVSVAGIAVHLLWLSPAYVGSPAAAADKGSFRVMTSNLRLGLADPTQVVEVAVKAKIDVLVLEEITAQELGRMEAAGLSEAFRYSAGATAEGHSGTMVFSDHKLGKPTRLETHSNGYAMKVRLGGRSITLLAVHPLPPIGDAQNWAEDQAAVRRAAVAAKGPTMIVGDFNATMDHQPLRELVGRGFRDAATEAKSRWQPTWPASGQVSVLGFGVPSMLALDHVFVNGPLHATSTRTVEIAGSDHRALLVTVS